jgi:predicted O-methyltransferase YrrM
MAYQPMWIFKKITRTIIQRISPSERKFQQNWPIIGTIEGFLVSPIQERWLFKMAKSLPDEANIVEIGSYKGRSTCCLAYGCEGQKKHVYAIDTFDGNDIDFHRKGFFEVFRRNIEKCGLAAYVTPIQGRSSETAKTWDKPIHLLFIDGSHAYEDVLVDFFGFFPHVVEGGTVALHDVTETWPGPLSAWNKVIKHQLDDINRCSTIAYGIKPK